MKAVWIDAGNDPDYTKLQKYAIDTAFFDLRDSRCTAAYFDGVRAKGLGVGVYAVASWFPQSTPQAFAQWVSGELLRIGWKGNPLVCLDIETHDIERYVVPCLQEWRRIRPNRPTWWTLEGGQGGLFTATDVTNIASLSVRVVPQFYRGDMVPLPHSPVIDLLMAGFQGVQLDGCYDAAALPWRWRGFAFTQGRLP